MNKQNPIWWDVFINEYLKNGGNGTQAYLKARPKVKDQTAASNAERLLRNADVQELISSKRKVLAQKLSITAEEWIKMVAEACVRDWKRIEETYAQLEPAADPVAVRCLTQARASINEMMRKNLCIADEPKIEVNHSGSVDFALSSNSLSKLNALRDRYQLLA